MNENFGSEQAVDGDLDQTASAQRRLVADWLTVNLRQTAHEWYGWDVAVDVIVADDHTVSAVYPTDALLEGRRKLQASVLNNWLRGTFKRTRVVSVA